MCCEVKHAQGAKQLEHYEGTPFFKYHFLGNDYIIINDTFLENPLNSDEISFICDRRMGIGADGVILNTNLIDGADYNIKFYNSDGSACGRSGNGLCIYSQWLIDQKILLSKRISVTCMAGVSDIEIFDDNSIAVDMGPVSYDPIEIGIIDPNFKSSRYTLETSVGPLDACSLFNGNPHTVIFTDIEPALRKKVGKEIAKHPLFKKGTNVQFITSINDTEIDIDIWERVAGYTPASGSSACAAATAALSRGLCKGASISVNMIGGNITILVRNSHVWQRGFATFSFSGVIPHSHNYQKCLM